MFQIDLKSRKSIYQQVVDNIKELIIKHVLLPDDKLPSVRELSRTLLINPNTVSKAYKELERQGYIYTTGGLGTFVAEVSEKLIDDKRLSEIRTQLEFYIDELYYAGLDDKRVKELFHKILEERGENK